MRMVRYVTSWLLYWTGHALNIPMRLRPFVFLYHPYSRVMLASVCCQGDMQRGPWRSPAEANAGLGVTDRFEPGGDAAYAPNRRSSRSGSRGGGVTHRERPCPRARRQGARGAGGAGVRDPHRGELAVERESGESEVEDRADVAVERIRAVAEAGMGVPDGVGGDAKVAKGTEGQNGEQPSGGSLTNPLPGQMQCAVRIHIATSARCSSAVTSTTRSSSHTMSDRMNMSVFVCLLNRARS